MRTDSDLVNHVTAASILLSQRVQQMSCGCLLRVTHANECYTNYVLLSLSALHSAAARHYRCITAASECDEGPSMAAGNDVCVLQNLRVVDDGRRESGNWQRIWTDDSRCDVGRGVIDRYSHLFLHPFASTITGLCAYAGTQEAS